MALGQNRVYTIPMNYRIIDSHCHPQFPQYDEDRDKVIRDSLDKGIAMICVGTDLEKSKAAVALAEKYEGLYASVGLHPNDELESAYNESEYRALAQHQKVVAIGEIGLDYYRTKDEVARSKQRERFISQLRLARALSLPVIIHCRDAQLKAGADAATETEQLQGAHDDMLNILRQHHAGLPAVIHSFNGSVQQARTYLNEGFCIGLNAIITYSRQYEEMVKSIPIERILLETDAPYLAPAPYRGKRNEPLYIEAVGNYIAGMRGISIDDLFATTTQNCQELFKLD
jgi:TatD DNase family protein